MIVRNQARRRVARDLARGGAVVSVLMLGLTAWIAAVGGHDAASAATAGAVDVVSVGQGAGEPLSGGGSSTQFTLLPPTGAACSGDSANQGYKWSTYIVPTTVDPSSLVFNNSGPVPPDTSVFHQPIYSASSSQIVNMTTGSGDGLVVGIPPMSFAVFTINDIPAGSYNIGIACVNSATQPASLDKLWNAQVTIIPDPADSPGGFTWTVDQVEPPTSSSTSSTSSTTVDPSSTTSTTAGAGGDGTTTSTADVLGVAISSDPISGTNLASLPRTGGSTISLLAWGALLLVFGRMAILFGRTPRVIPASG